MSFPKMKPRPASELKIPDLAGGMNLRDGLSEVLDNQLTDCKNMWWNDGLLKTRPGTYQTGAISTIGYDEKIIPKQTNVYIGQYRLFFYNISGTRKAETNDYSVEVFGETGFWFQQNDEIIELPTLEHKHTNFVCQKKNTIYAFCESQEIWKMEFDSDYTTPTKKCDWTQVLPSEMYSPIVLSDCKAGDYIVQSAETVMSSGAMVEGYNLLSDSYRVQYTAFNPEIAFEDTYEGSDEKFRKHQMRYFLPESKESLRGKTIIVKHTNNMGTAEHKVTFSGSSAMSSEEKLNDIDSLNLCCRDNEIWFNQNLDDMTKPYYVNDYEEGYRNNIEVTIPYTASYEEKAKVFNMTQCEWFGGDAHGISGGSRLFLCGNSGKEKALVMWSGLNDPLYFSENCYAYVGDENQAVTCFGKQGESLVIFKEKGAGSFYTTYVQNNNITASDLINQTVVDYTASSVYFPIVTLHPTIGCDYPDTVQLCRNRLVWACSDGKVYTLATQNQYSERNIFCVSKMIERKLCEEDLTNAFSADYNGHYLLFVKNQVYVMDYESYGYVYIASHTKDENAQVKIPWWYWELPSGEYNNEEAIAVISFGTRVYVVFYPKEPNGLFSEFSIKKLSTDFNTDDGENIPSMIRTKLFDFGQPSYRKNVDKINLQLGNNGGEAIKVKIITECGEEEQEITLTGTETQSYTPGYIDSKAIFPCIRQTVKIGLELSSTGVLAIDGMSFKYRQTGGCR